MKHEMNRAAPPNRSHRARLYLLALLLAGTASAHTPSTLPAAGTWVGSDAQDGQPSSVRLVLGTTSGADVLTVQFGARRHCTLTARRSRVYKDRLVFDTVDSNGGTYCDALYPGTLSLEPQTDATLTLQAQSKDHHAAFRLWKMGADKPSDAGNPEALLGTWTGTVNAGRGAPTGVRLTIDGVDPGDRENTLRFDGDRRCTATLAYEGVVKSAYYFSVTLSGNLGGFCNRLADRYLVAQPDDGHLRYHFEPATGDCATDCVLDSDPEPSPASRTDWVQRGWPRG